MPGPGRNELELIARRIAALAPPPVRLCIAVAGPPGSGKSTFAEALVAHLNSAGPGGAALVPMDGFHLDNAVLAARGLCERKGAPETFDAAGFCRMVARLAAEPEVVIPVFDRARDIAIAGAAVIGAEVRIAVVEGNYLLLDRPPWNSLRDAWDLSVFLDVPEPELRDRLQRRWLAHGLDEAAARARAERNDLPNARLVLTRSAAADITL